MKEINSNDKIFQENRTEFESLQITIEGDFLRSGANFKNCTFLIKPKLKVELTGCSLEDCTFYGATLSMDDFIYRKTLKLISSTLVTNLAIGGGFSSIKINKTAIFGFKDFSESDSIQFDDLDIYDFDIQGKCEKLYLNNCFFSIKKIGFVSLWDKEIIRNADCKNVVFNSSKINPYFLSSKCADKSSIDLSNSTLIDNWSRLRKKYSGMQLYIILVLTIIFFLPIITKAAILLLLSSLNYKLKMINEVPLWKVIFFNNEDGFSGMFFFTLTLILIFYTIGRFYVTQRIASLREEELFLSDSKFQLISIPPSKYETELKIDKMLNWLFIISILYSIYNFFESLFILVPVIKS